MLLVQPRWRLVLGTTAAVAAVAVVSIAGTATAIIALGAGHPHLPDDQYDEGGATPAPDETGGADEGHGDADHHDAEPHEHDDP